MFYSQFILAKKGPLGTIWIAAHLERKLRKNQVADTDIGDSVDSILFPDVPIALRLSSHLLLGVVRIYSRKVNYLFDDCSEALLKIKQAFRSTAVDLPPEESTAPYHSITLPETFDLDDFELPDNEMLHGNYVDHHVSTREQITLQDTMDGVVYSTSQFGLDERFGDGDTSQIGLDLDEDLFLEKVAAPGHDGISDADPAFVTIMIPLKKDAYRDQNEGFATDTNSLGYAEAPSTPGLVEEPNFSSIPEAPTCDDHLESEDHNLRDKAAIEKVENADNGKKNIDGSNNDNVTCMRSEDNDYHGAFEIKRTESQGGSASTPPGTGHMSADNHLSPSVVVEQVEPISLLSECSDRTVGASNGPDTVQDMQIDITDPISLNRSDVGCLESVKGRLEEAIASPSKYSTYPLVSEDHLVDNQASLQQEICSNAEFLEGSGTPQACADLKDPKTVDPLVRKELASVSGPVLQACSSHLSQSHESSLEGENAIPPNLPSEVVGLCSSEESSREAAHRASGASTEVQGGLSRAKDSLLKPVSGETQGLSGDVQGDFERLDKQTDSVNAIDNPVENVTSPASSDLPAPEKLLSVPNGLNDKPNEFLVESTPDKDLIASDDGGDAGMKQISGKKRSFTESTLTVQSLNSVESFGVTQSKKTAESIPDDDDLLSSILVGRRPIVLKMKPTPPVADLVSMKRPRSALRGSSSKRKVLMDDPMVLHGDTIRQQLTSTEDIRRVRKKAPCTWTEISMIQRELLEEEILSQPVLTNASTELSSLHFEKYDLSRIRVSETSEGNRFSDLVRDVECSGKPDATGEIGIQDIFESVADRNGWETQPTEPSLHTENQQNENDGERAEMEVDRSCIAVADADVAVRLGSESSSPIGLATRDACDQPAQLAAVDKNTEEDAQKDGLCTSPLKETDSHTVNVDARDGKGIGPTEIVSDADNHVFVETDSRPQDECLLEERKDDAWTELGAGFQDGCSAPNDEENTLLATMSPLTDGCKNLEFVNGDHVEEKIEEKVCVVNEDEKLTADIKCDDENLTLNHIFNKEPKSGLPYSEEPDMDMQNAYLNDAENPCDQEAGRPSTMYDEVTGYYPSVEDHGDFGSAVVANDTEFLNVDDDEIAEEEEDLDPHAEETNILENSGWSSRTRAVAKYLQTLFDKEAVQGRKVIPMDNLLSGKTRKEASRMFFETLVLKTKDYIHVEQVKPFDNVNIKPNIKLMKSDF